jgi:hypothetical protein
MSWRGSIAAVLVRYGRWPLRGPPRLLAWVTMIDPPSDAPDRVAAWVNVPVPPGGDGAV